MQCKEKRHDIFIILLNTFTAVIFLSSEHIKSPIKVLVFHMIINILSVLWGVPYINTVGLTWAFKPENFFSIFYQTKIRSWDYPVTHSVTPFVNFFFFKFVHRLY